MRNRVLGPMVAPAAVMALLSLVLVAAPTSLASFVGVVEASGGGAQAPTATSTRWEPPRTPDGQPDIRGFWIVPDEAGNQGGAQWSIEGSTSRLSLTSGELTRTRSSKIVDPADGKIPYQPWAAKIAREHFDNHTYPTKPEYVDGRTRCYLPGVPRQIWSATGGYQILQTPGYVVMMIEFSHAYRIIPLDGSPHVGETIKLWQGDSRGHWEGNTLVVDVTNNNDKTWFDQVGDFHSDAMHVVERFTAVDPDTIKYEATIEDQKAYTRPWKIVFTASRNKEPGFELMEHSCHEGERAVEHFLSYRTKTDEKD